MVKVLLVSIIICIVLYLVLRFGICSQSPEKLIFMRLTRSYPTWMIVCSLLWALSIVEVIIVTLITVITCL